MPLEKEISTYEKMKEELLKTYAGKFALIHGEELCGTYDTTENAYAEGVKRFGTDPFLVREITAQPQIYRNQALALGLIHARL